MEVAPLQELIGVIMRSTGVVACVIITSLKYSDTDKSFDKLSVVSGGFGRARRT